MEKIVVAIGPGQAVGSDTYRITASDGGLDVTSTVGEGVGGRSTHHIAPHEVTKNGVPAVAAAEIGIGTNNGDDVIFRATNEPGVNVIVE